MKNSNTNKTTSTITKKVTDEMIREVAKARYSAMGVSEEGVKAKIAEAFPTLSDADRLYLFHVSGRYVEAMQFVALKYFPLWMEGGEKKAAIEEIHYFSGFDQKEKWIFWDIFNELTGFIWQIVEDGLGKLVEPHIKKYDDVVVFLKEGGKVFLPKKAKAITIAARTGILPKHIFTRLCGAIETVLKEQQLEYEARKRLAAEKAAAEKTAAAEKAALAKKAAAEKAAETLKKILAAEKLQMNPSGFAFKLDGIIVSKEEAMVLDKGARFLLDEAVYVVAIKGNKKIIRPFMGGSIRKETENVAVEAEKVEVPKSLEVLWLSSIQGKKTVRAYIIPAGLNKASFVATCKTIHDGMVATLADGNYRVAQIKHDSPKVVGLFRRATDEEKKAAKAAMEKAPKKLFEVTGDGPMAEAFRQAATA